MHFRNQQDFQNIHKSMRIKVKKTDVSNKNFVRYVI